MLRPLSAFVAVAIASPAFAQPRPTLTPKDYGQWELLAWTNVRRAEPSAVRLDPSTVANLAGLRIADYRRPTWSADGRLVYFGPSERRPAGAFARGLVA